jgi:hypothetical protein
MAKRSEEALKKAKEFKCNGRKKDAFAPFFKSVIFRPEERISSKIEMEQAALPWSGELFSAEALLGFVHACTRTFRAILPERGTSLQYAIPGRFLHHLFAVINTKEEGERLYLPALVAALNRLDTRDNVDLVRIKHTLLKLSTLSYLHPAITWLELLSRGKSERGA